MKRLSLLSCLVFSLFVNSCDDSAGQQTDGEVADMLDSVELSDQAELDGLDGADEEIIVDRSRSLRGALVPASGLSQGGELRLHGQLQLGSVPASTGGGFRLVHRL